MSSGHCRAICGTKQKHHQSLPSNCLFRLNVCEAKQKQKPSPSPSSSSIMHSLDNGHPCVSPNKHLMQLGWAISKVWLDISPGLNMSKCQLVDRCNSITASGQKENFRFHIIHGWFTSLALPSKPTIVEKLGRFLPTIILSKSKKLWLHIHSLLQVSSTKLSLGENT